MDVITMRSTTSILKRLQGDYPQFTFKKGASFYWSSSDKTIFYINSAKSNLILLLHELSHAILGHNNYDQDIQLITMERQAWENTKILAKKYKIDISDDTIQSNLDSYRDWLHSRSTCPKCNSNGLQIDSKTYECFECHEKWRVNEARTCALRRYKSNK